MSATKVDCIRWIETDHENGAGDLVAEVLEVERVDDDEIKLSLLDAADKGEVALYLSGFQTMELIVALRAELLSW